MADDNGSAPPKPPPDDAFAVTSKKQRFVQAKGGGGGGAGSLVARCRAVVCANLDRYPADMFGMVSEDDWEDIVRFKHQTTAPQKGSGGLDGTGRRTPALSEKFLSEVEELNEHLADSTLADALVWKDCVEFSFARAGRDRPRALLVPWPVLVQQVADVGAVLNDWRKKEDAAEQSLDDEQPFTVSEDDQKAIIEATRTLQKSPMNLTLLKESGIGKTLKKIIKASSNRSETSIFQQIRVPQTGLKQTPKPRSVLKELEDLLQSWMDLAASKGVDVAQKSSSGRSVSPRLQEQFQNDAADLLRVQKCHTWRQLFALLRDRKDTNRFNLGQKMRDNRKRENKLRPQIVKVRPANSPREALLHKHRQTASHHTWARGGGTVASHGGAKVLALRKEAAIQSARQKSGVPTFKKQSGFGQAVAFASTTKLTAHQKMLQQQDRKRKAASLVSMGAGKRMAVPQKAMRMQGTTFQNPHKTKKPAPRKQDNSRRR